MWPAPAMLLQGFAGGLLIGLAASIMLIGLGRIAGVSGLAARAVGLSPSGPPRLVASAFIIGLPLGAWLLAGPVAPRFPVASTLIIGGLIVGFGTRLGSGCTSGHGVCGISRLSARSLIATALFITSGVATVAAVNALGLSW